MQSLYELVFEVTLDDHLAWLAEGSFEDIEQVHPKTVTGVIKQDDGVRVDAEGVDDGEYFFMAWKDGASEAYFLNPAKEQPVPQGSVRFAELTDEPGMVTVREGVFDSRTR